MLGDVITYLLIRASVCPNGLRNFRHLVCHVRGRPGVLGRHYSLSCYLFVPLVLGYQVCRLFNSFRHRAIFYYLFSSFRPFFALERPRGDPYVALARPYQESGLPFIETRLRRPRLVYGNELVVTRPRHHVLLDRTMGFGRLSSYLHLLRMARVPPLGVLRRDGRYQISINDLRGGTKGNLRPNRR